VGEKETGGWGERERGIYRFGIVEKKEVEKLGR